MAACRQRRYALRAARPVCAASGGPVSAAPAGGRGGAPGGGWPWRRARRWRRVDRWALVQGGGRHCAGRETAPARAWRRWGSVRQVGTVGRSLRSIRPPLAPALRAAKGVRPSALSPSPPGEAKVCGQLRSPHGQAAPLSPACQRGQRNGQGSWPGCQLRLCGAASPLLGIMGALPPNPRAPQSLAGRRGWGGRRTPLRRGPRPARRTGLPRVAG